MAETSNTTLYVLGGGALLLALAAGGTHAYRRRKRSSAAAEPAKRLTDLDRFKRGDYYPPDAAYDLAERTAKAGLCDDARKVLVSAEADFKTAVKEDPRWKQDLRTYIPKARKAVRACGRAAPQRRKRKKARKTVRRRRS